MGGKGSLETQVIQMVEIRFIPGWIFEPPQMTGIQLFSNIMVLSTFKNIISM